MFRSLSLTALALLVPLAALAQGEGEAPAGEATPGMRIDAAAGPFGFRDAGAIPSGSVATGPAGERLAMVSARRGRELWKIGEDGEVLDTGYFVSGGAAGRIRVEWERSPAFEWRAATGSALPWQPTGERFDAFRLSDWLVARTEPVALPFLGGENVGFRFGPGGALTAGAVGGEEVKGAWWWSRGLLHVRLDGFEEVATYEWRALARHVGWDSGMSAPVAEGAVARAPRRPERASPAPRALPGAAAVCHRDVLGALLRTAAERSDVVSALGIEKETLLLCGDRQKLVVEILEAERRLAELIAESVKEPAPPPEPAPPVVRTVTQLVAAEPAAPPPAEPEGVAAAAVEWREDAVRDESAPAESRAASPAPRPPAANWRWFSMIGREGRLVAGVTDGSGAWFVAEGERVPGAGVVTRISARPPAVEVAGIGPIGWTERPPGVGGTNGHGSRQAAPAWRPAAAGGPDPVVERVFGRGGGAEPDGGTLRGRADAVDGDTLRMGDARIRLWGIDAPEKDQTCRAEGLEWACGLLATAALRSRATDLSCRGKERDRYGRVLAVCFEGGTDVNAWLVAEGWALAYRAFATDYVEEEEAARKARRGMHRGDFVEPWRWRRGDRLDAGEGAASRAGSDAGRPEERGARRLPPLPGRERVR